MISDPAADLAHYVSGCAPEVPVGHSVELGHADALNPVGDLAHYVSGYPSEEPDRDPE